MQYHIVRQGEVFEAHLTERLMFADSTIFRQLLNDAKQSGAKSVTFDFKGVAAIDSAGLGMLMIAVEEGRRHNWTLSIVHPQTTVLKLLQLSRLDQIIKVA